MAQSRDHSIVGVALLSALCSVLSSALFTRIFSHAVVRNNRRSRHGDRPSRLRFEAPAAPSETSDRRTKESGGKVSTQESGNIYACGGRGGFVRFVRSEEECHGNEDLYSWSVGGATAAIAGGAENEQGCSVFKEDGVVTLTCGNSFAPIYDGTDGDRGAPGTGCSVTKNEEGVAVLTCGEDSVNIVDGAAGQDGAGCSASNEDGVTSLSCGDDLIQVLDGLAGPAGEGCTVSKTDGVASVTCGENTVSVADGADGGEGPPGEDGRGCSVSKSGGVATVTCGHSSSAQIADGPAGPAGRGCTVSKTDGVATIDCGGDTVQIFDGKDADGGDGEGGEGGDVADKIVKLDTITATYGGKFRSTESEGMGVPVQSMQPSLGVNLIIRYQPDSSGDAYLGEIRMYAGPVIPPGWLLCDGTQLEARDSEFTPLFQVIGNAYYPPGGVQPGRFAVPDLRGRVPLGAGPVDEAAGQAVDLAERHGSYRVALSPDNLPKHSHMLAEVHSIAGTASVEATS